VKKFDAAYQKEYGSRTDHNGLKGYIGMYTVKAVTEKMGKFDSKAFAAAMKNVSLSAKTNPGLLLDLSYDENGDLDRESYLTTVVNGKQVVSAILPPVGKK
jgi:branched-chain amino acid transport system substrate-binding protein